MKPDPDLQRTLVGPRASWKNPAALHEASLQITRPPRRRRLGLRTKLIISLGILFAASAAQVLSAQAASTGEQSADVKIGRRYKLETLTTLYGRCGGGCGSGSVPKIKDAILVFELTADGTKDAQTINLGGDYEFTSPVSGRLKLLSVDTAEMRKHELLQPLLEGKCPNLSITGWRMDQFHVRQVQS